MSSRISSLLSGLGDSLRFTNWLGVICQRTFQKNSPIVHYVWKGKWHMFSNHRFGDHGSIKEVLAQGAYDECLAKVCRGPTFTYVNVGANVGSFDIAVAARGIPVPYACTIELNPWTYSRLAFNISANGLYSVRPLNLGIAGAPGVIPFAPRENSVTDCIYNSVTDGATAVQDVELDTMDGALRRAGLDGKTFDLLKLDAEGAEYGIIETISPESLRRFQNIVMELHHPPEGASPESIYRKLESCGFVSLEPRWTSGRPPELRFWSRA